VALVRVLLLLAIGAVGVALILYVVRRDRHYLTFIVRVVQYTLVMLLAVLLWFAFERLVL